MMANIQWHKIYPFNTSSKAPLLAGSVVSKEVAGKKLVVAYTGTDWFVLDDYCPHAGASFGKGGWCENDSLVCPIHRHRFNLKTGRGMMGDYVPCYPVEVREDGVYVGIERKTWQWKLW